MPSSPVVANSPEILDNCLVKLFPTNLILVNPAFVIANCAACFFFVD